MKYTKKLGFTLVELIVVITILVILGTIAFISLQGYSSQARDSKRISEISSIDKLLSVYLVKVGYIPKPENSINITASGEIIGYQGEVGKQNLNILGMSELGKDPLDNNYYTYRTNENLNKYQVLGFLENGDDLSYNELIENIEARDYEEDEIYTKGDELGVLLDSITNIPANQVGLSVDLVNTEIEYKNVFASNDIITGTGETLKLSILGGGLVGYWDFEEIEGDGFIDKSGNDIVSTMTGGVTLTGGINGNGIYLDGTINTYVLLNSLPNLGTYSNNPHTISAWLNINEIEQCGSNSCRQWVLLLGEIGSGAHHWLLGGLRPSQFGIRDSVQLEPSLTQGIWQHIVVVYNGINITMYINGIKADTKDVLFKDIQMNLRDADLLLGKKLSGDKNYKGYIDELGVYNKALSSQEIQLLYTISGNY